MKQSRHSQAADAGRYRIEAITADRQPHSIRAPNYYPNWRGLKRRAAIIIKK